MPNILLDLRDEILANSNVPEGLAYRDGPTTWEIAELGLFNIGILTQAAGRIIERRSEPEPPIRSEGMAEKLGSVVLPTLSHVGSLKDDKSNKLMAVIGGPLFDECFQVLKGLTNHRTYARLSTADDLIQAHAIDAAIAEHAADYITSEQGAYLLKPLDDTTMGCPLRRMYGEDSTMSYFDQLATRAISEYDNPSSPYFKLGYYGIAQSIVLRTQPDEHTDPLRLSDPVAYALMMDEWDPGQVWENQWQLPELSEPGDN